MSNPSQAAAAARPRMMTQPPPPPTSPESPSGPTDAAEGASGVADAVEGATGAESGARARQAATVARARIAGWSTGVLATLLVAFLGVGVTMLVQTLNTNSNRISDLNGSVISLQSSMDSRFAETNREIDRLEDRMDAEFDKVDARFDEVDAEFDRVDARFDRLEAILVALVASLGQTDAVDNVLEGRLTSIGSEPG